MNPVLNVKCFMWNECTVFNYVYAHMIITTIKCAKH